MMNTKDFSKFVELICRELKHVSDSDPKKIANCKSGEDFEGCVVELVQTVVAKNYPGIKIYYTKGSHAFPDIVLEFPGKERYGIEVKSSSTTSKSWKINGNSVLGSTKEDVLDTYIIFGKTAIGHQAFRWKRYEEAVSNVEVTHSPRYMIDMDIETDKTFFTQSNLSYQEITESKIQLD